MNLYDRDFDSIKRFLKDGNIDCENGYPIIVRYLKICGCPISDLGNGLILWAHNNGYEDIVKYMLEFGCNHYKIGQKIKYEVSQSVKMRVFVFMHTVPNYEYVKMEILKRIIN